MESEKGLTARLQHIIEILDVCLVHAEDMAGVVPKEAESAKVTETACTICAVDVLSLHVEELLNKANYLAERLATLQGRLGT